MTTTLLVCIILSVIGVCLVIYMTHQDGLEGLIYGGITAIATIVGLVLIWGVYGVGLYRNAVNYSGVMSSTQLDNTVVYSIVYSDNKSLVFNLPVTDVKNPGLKLVKNVRVVFKNNLYGAVMSTEIESIDGSVLFTK